MKCIDYTDDNILSSIELPRQASNVPLGIGEFHELLDEVDVLNVSEGFLEQRELVNPARLEVQPTADPVRRAK